jgi:hypothetical protein
MRYFRFYKLEYNDPDDGNCVSWHLRYRDAIAELAEIQEGGGLADQDVDLSKCGTIRKVEIYMSTEELVRWLNLHFTRDNG